MPQIPPCILPVQPMQILWFDGNAIAAYHRGGTYELVNFRILDADGTTVSQRADAGSVIINPEEYGNMQAILTDTYSEYGAYPDDTGRYESLNINVSIQAVKDTKYSYSASLVDEQGNLIQAMNGVTKAKSSGEMPLTLEFSGETIYAHQMNGTFSLRSLNVYGPDGFDRRSNPFITRSYNFTGFTSPIIRITGNVTDYPVDYDGNGLYDAIRLGFDVETGHRNPFPTTPLSAALMVPDIAANESFGTLIARAGNNDHDFEQDRLYHVTLDFPGTSINGKEIDGPYMLGKLQAGDTYSGLKPSYYVNPEVPYTTAAYDYTQFEPAAFLSGYVSNEYGLPLENVEITALGKRGSTDGAGYYRIFYEENLSGGVHAQAPSELNMSTDYKVRSVSRGTTTFCNFTLFSPARVWGTVTAENGTLMTDGFVHSTGPTTSVFTLDTWGNGSYQLAGIKNGTYNYIVYSPPPGSGLVSDRLTDVEIIPGENREWNIIAYNARSISGTVRDFNGNPLEEAEVSVTEGPITITWPYAPDTDAAGAYTFPSLIPGNYTMVVEPPWDDRNLLVTNTSNITISLSDSVITYDIILMPKPVAPEVWWPDISPADGPAPLTVSFTDQSRGYPTSWLWEFGDGESSDEQNPFHVYSAEGTYNVTLTVTNDHGSDTDVFEDCIVVTGSPRLVLPTGTLDPAGTGTFALSADDLSDASRVILTLTYDPDIVQLNGVQNGAVIVDTIDTSIDNAAGEAVITLNLKNMQSFTGITRLADLNFAATGSAGEITVLSADPADQIACAGGEGCWPGALEILTNLSVTSGSISITGGSDSLPVADFTGSPRGGNAPFSVTFDSSAANVLSPTAYLWAFGDGSTSSLANPEHTYSSPGMFDVALTVTNLSGSDIMTRPGYIAVSPASSQETYLFVTTWGYEGSGTGGEAEFSLP